MEQLQPLQTHTHNGFDSPKIDPRNLTGFPILNSVPTYDAQEGTIVLYWNGSTTYELYARINKGWRKIALT